MKLISFSFLLNLYIPGDYISSYSCLPAGCPDFGELTIINRLAVPGHFKTICWLIFLEKLYLMDKNQDLGNFFRENGKLIRDYVEVRMEICRLRLIGLFSKSAGYLVWIVISLFLLFLFFLFLSIIAGFWLSELTNSYIKGFGLVALLILLKIIVLTLFRKSLFINPVVRTIIKHSGKLTIRNPEETEKNVRHEKD